ncbi:MAG: FmdB family transcriptional regulator [Cryobacterium sp.]|nr:FmdB family transcriptional regulator [Cryobacterium sp.]
MPTYSYRCADCAHAFDIQQAFTDDSLTVCPECGGTLRKVFGNVGVTFSGSGFYRTDSRESKSTSSDAKKPSEASTGSVKDAGGASSAPAKSDSSSSAATTSNKTPAASQ